MYVLLEGWVHCSLGDLSFPVDERSARFVAACLIELLRTLHGEASAVCRGLSANELYVTTDGLVSPTTFTHGKRLDAPTFTVCGVRGHLAPEVISGSGHSFPVDFWALGVLLFELLTGSSPFIGEGATRQSTLALVGQQVAEVDEEATGAAADAGAIAGNGDASEMAVYERILAHKRGTLRARMITARMAQDVPPLSDACMDFVDRLVDPVVERRLGTDRGPDALADHPWFSSEDSPFPWQQLQDGEMASPLLAEAQAVAEEAARRGFEAAEPADDGLVTEPFAPGAEDGGGVVDFSAFDNVNRRRRQSSE